MKKKKKEMLSFYAMAHTQTFFNRRHLFCGLKDSKLTPEGHKNAKVLGEKLKNKKIGIAFVSPLTRARETARHILKYHPDAEIFLDGRIVERNYGKLSGKSKDKFARENPKIFPIYHRSYDVPPPGGESMKQVEKRALAFLKDAIVKIKKEKKNAIFVAHSNTLRPIRRYFEKLTPKEMMALEGQYNKIYEYKIPA
jgi:broad specificity phosphatase PhoE